VPAGLWVAVSSPADPDMVDRLEGAVSAELAAAHRTARLDDFSIVLAAGDTVLGGICGSVFGSSCELLHLFVVPEQRGGGLGARLLRLAEAEAQRRGCRRTVLFTHASQGAWRYRRHGYREVGRVEDYPDGDVALWFAKDLLPP
jgi:GNAT superfamily N-acetyltransferase